MICPKLFVGSLREEGEGGGVCIYKFSNLIFIHFLAISGNSDHFDFYDLPQHFRGVPRGSKGGNIEKSNFDKFSRHFRQFITVFIFMIFPKSRNLGVPQGGGRGGMVVWLLFSGGWAVMMGL